MTVRLVRVLLLGASGLVGGEALRLLVANPLVGRVVAPTRRPLPCRPKLENVVGDLRCFHPAAVDAVVCAFGTTRAKAGSDDEFVRVDRDLPALLGTRAKNAGAEAFALVSAAGANARSPFLYIRTKGELEEAIDRLDFRSLTIVRPGFISGDRREVRRGEHTILAAMRLLSPVLPLSWRPSDARRIAAALVEAAVRPTVGVTTVGPRMLA